MTEQKITAEKTRPVERKICRSCGFQSSEKTLWICPSCHADTFEHEINLSPEDLANLKAGRKAF